MLVLAASTFSIMDAGVPAAARSRGFVRLAQNYLLWSPTKDAPTRSASTGLPTNVRSPRVLECSASPASRAAAGDDTGIPEGSAARTRAASSLPCGAPATSASPPAEGMGPPATTK